MPQSCAANTPPPWARRSRLLLLGGVICSVLACWLLPSLAAAEPLCTNNWTGASEGEWTVAANWSAKHTPTSSDVVCIAAGHTVTIESGVNQVGVLEDKGALVIKGATLEVSNTLEPSTVQALTLKFNAILTGPATVDISGSLTWAKESTMSGTGSTVILSGATATLTTECINGKLTERTLRNEGTFTDDRQLLASAGAVVENAGTFNANIAQGEGNAIHTTSTGTAPHFVNTGVFRKHTGSGETFVEINFENKGTVKAETAPLKFYNEAGTAATMTLANSSVVEGNVTIAFLAIAAGSFTAPSGTLTIERGTMTVASGATAAIANFVMKFEGNVAGAGTLTVSKSFDWHLQSTMSGAGRTVLQPSATSEVAAGNDTVQLKERTLVNEGTVSLLEQTILTESAKAKLENLGIF